MDLLKTHKRQTRVSETVYVFLNIALAVVLVAVVHASQSPWLALVVFLISKWRALAVRPRFWFPNLVANMVDIIVGVSTVALLYAVNGILWLEVALAILFVGWLLFIKPRSSKKFVALQAGLAVFLGITALSLISYSWNVAVFVACTWVIGYVATRHVLSSYDESYTTLFSLAMGLIFAEMGWIGFHWLMAYPLPGFGDIQLSQLALLMVLLCSIVECSYRSYRKYSKVRWTDIAPAVILAAALSIVMYVFAILFKSDML